MAEYRRTFIKLLARLLIFAPFLAYQCSGQAQAQGQATQSWVVSGESSNQIFFVDVNSLAWDNEILSGWSLRYSKFERLESKMVGWTITREKWTCGSNRFKAGISTIAYGRNGEAIYSTSLDGSWQAVVPGSVGASVSDIVCLFAPRAPRVLVDNATNVDVQRQLAADSRSGRIFERRGITMGYEDGSTKPIFYFASQFYYALDGDCAFNAAGEELVATEANWVIMTCAEYRATILPLKEATKRSALIRLDPVASVDAAITKARSLMPWAAAPVARKLASAKNRQPKRR
jgi:hypothetical protein